MTETDPTARRRQLVAERLLEDEGLTGALNDAQATPLLQWACAQAGEVAADATRNDDEVDAAVSAIRAAVRKAAALATSDPAQIVTLAAQAMGQAVPPPTQQAAEAPPVQAGAPIYKRRGRKGRKERHSKPG